MCYKKSKYSHENQDRTFRIKNLLIEAAMLGAEAAEKRRSPTSDRMKQREVHSWLKTLGHKPAILDKMVKEELVKPHRNGESKNSPLVYSRMEIEAALTAYKSLDSVNGI